MRQADYSKFKDVDEGLIRDADLALPLDERVVVLSDVILQAAQQYIPTAKPHSRTYKDSWIYGPRVKELNRRINVARKNFRRHPSTINRRYLQSVARHAKAENTRLRQEAWIDWCQSVGSHTPVSEMWRRVKYLYRPRPPPLPTHPAPEEAADRLARVFADCTPLRSTLLPLRDV